MFELVVIVAGFISISGFFAMIDAAVLNVTPAEVEVLITRKKWGARELKSLLRNTSRAIIVIVIFTNVTNILGPILAGQKAVALFGSSAIGYMTAFLTFTTIICSEIIPKSFGAHNAPRISRRAAPFLLALVTVLYPIVWVLERVVRLFKSGKRKIGTEEQIRALANIGGGAGHIDADELNFIHRAFVLNDRKARDIMIPFPSVMGISADVRIQQAARTVFLYHFSRYPVFGKSSDDVRGYILSHDILSAMAEGKGSDPVTPLIREILTVDADLPCDALLNLLRKHSAQLAMVIDDAGIVGLVTLEDVLEELVGEIYDESDAG
ncbi:MAG: hemolysin family protein [Patescibacteria group bacterium]